MVITIPHNHKAVILPHFLLNGCKKGIEPIRNIISAAMPIIRASYRNPKRKDGTNETDLAEAVLNASTNTNLNKLINNKKITPLRAIH